MTNSIEIRIIELEKVRKFYGKNKNNIKAQWMLFLDDPNSKEVREIMEKNEEIKEATVVVKQMSEDEKMQRLAFLREKAILDEQEIIETATNKGLREGMEKGLEQGREEGMKQGIEQGEKRKSTEIAKELLKENMPIEKIAKITKLSKEEIEQLQKN